MQSFKCITRTGPNLELKEFSLPVLADLYDVNLDLGCNLEVVLQRTQAALVVDWLKCLKDYYRHLDYHKIFKLTQMTCVLN